MPTLEDVKQSDLQAAADYVNKVYKAVEQRNPHEAEFLQAVKKYSIPSRQS